MAVTHGMRTMEQNGHAPGHGSAQKPLSQVRHHVLVSSELQRVRAAEAAHYCHSHAVLHLKAGPKLIPLYNSRVLGLKHQVTS